MSKQKIYLDSLISETNQEVQALVPYARCQLFEDTLTGGSLGSNDHIGFARVRYVDAHDVSGDTEDGINLYLFDVKMFTKIGYSSHTGTAKMVINW